MVEALAVLNTSESREALWKIAAREKNPVILAAIIGTWGARPDEAIVTEALKKHLAGSSYRSTLEVEAIKALRAQDDEAAAASEPARLQKPHDIQGRDVGAVLDALAFLPSCPTSTSRDAVCAYLAGKLTYPCEEWRMAAARALGTFRNPKA